MIEALDKATIAKIPFIVIGPECRKVTHKSWGKLIKVVSQGHLQVVFKVCVSPLFVTPLTCFVDQERRIYRN